jgi:peroxiredoxin
MAHDPMTLPSGLPEPEDDGAADHLRGAELPDLALPATDGSTVHVAGLPRMVLFGYPRTGVPGEDPLVPDWDLIPGARGCTPEVCSFRDLHAAFAQAGAEVYGFSTQDTDYQREAAERLQLPFPLLSDADLALTRALRLPTFQAAGQTLIKRLTLVVASGRIEHVFYPVFPPDGHADEVLALLQGPR